MQISEFVRIIEDTLPPKTAMDGDRIGVQVFTGNGEITSVLTCLEITDSVLDEALELCCDCIITFHPLIFSPIRSIVTENRIGRSLSRAIKHDISIIAIHTNFDAHPEGTNCLLAQRLGLEIIKTLVPDEFVKKHGMGVLCHCSEPISTIQLVERVRNVCGSSVRYSEGPNSRITSVAIVAGSGVSFLQQAIASGAQAFITADVKYHTFHEAVDFITLIDPGHYEMEQFVPLGLTELLRRQIENYENAPRLCTTTSCTNPVKYLS